MINKLKIDFGKFKIDLKLLGDLFVLAGAGLSVYYILNTILNDYLDNTVKNKENEKKGSGILKKIQAANPHLKNLSFNQYEKALLNSLVTPEEIAVTFDDIGGLSDIIDELREAVILPLTEPELFAAHLSLIQSPKGYYSTVHPDVGRQCWPRQSPKKVVPSSC